MILLNVDEEDLQHRRCCGVWEPHWARELAVKQKELSVRKANSAKPSQSDLHRQEEEEEEERRKKQNSSSVLSQC